MSSSSQDQATEGVAQRRSRGRPPALSAEHKAALAEIVVKQPHATVDEVRHFLLMRHGLGVCETTIRKALRSMGLKRNRPLSRPASDAVAPAKRYGYTQAHRRDAGAAGYSTNLTEAEWALVQDLFERAPGSRGMPARLPRRVMVDACCYVLRTGCSWRLLPKSFPPWSSVYRAFSRWARAGVFELMHDRLREQWRQRLQRAVQPSAAVLDAQSSRSSPQGGNVGFDAGKKVKGRKRHLLVDTLGLLLAVCVTAASVQDRDAAPQLLAMGCAKAPSIKTLFVDSAYSGQCAARLQAQQPGLTVQVVRNPAQRNVWHSSNPQLPLWSEPLPGGFTALPKRWVVERTHAWNDRSRRLLAHHDRSLQVATAWVWLAEARILASRLTVKG